MCLHYHNFCKAFQRNCRLWCRDCNQCWKINAFAPWNSTVNKALDDGNVLVRCSSHLVRLLQVASSKNCNENANNLFTLPTFCWQLVQWNFGFSHRNHSQCHPLSACNPTKSPQTLFWIFGSCIALEFCTKGSYVAIIANLCDEMSWSLSCEQCKSDGGHHQTDHTLNPKTWNINPET